MITRWICEKDSKKWLYPIKKCIYCKGEIKKQVTTEAKVMGITKVNIPSPFHPITPYNIVLLEDKFGNRMPKKTMKDYNIRDTYVLEKATTDSAVVITRIKYDLGESLKGSLDLLRSFDVKEGDNVLIKPCVIEPAYSYQAVNTNPQLLEEIIKMLRARGVSDILVADQAMAGNDVGASAKKSGILDICTKNKVQIRDLAKSEYIEKEADGMIFKVAEEIIGRKIINVPVMKTNSQIGISGAVENMLRVVHEETQKEMFAQDIEKTLPKLMKALPGFVTIGDATLGMQGQGPTLLGEPAFMNMLYVSTDPVALDTVFSKACMFQQPVYLGAAMDIEVVGEELDAIKYPVKGPDPEASAHPKISLIDGKSSPFIFNTALKLTAKLVGSSGYDMSIAVGKFITEDMTKGKSRIIAYGVDAIKRLRDMNVRPLAEIKDDVDNIEKLVLMKSIFENPGNVKATDKLKSKLAGIGAKIKSIGG